MEQSQDPPKDDEVKDMYDDPRRNVKLAKPLSWEQIMELQWAFDARLHTLDDYKKFKESRKPQQSTAFRTVDQDQWKGYVPLKKDEEEQPKATKSKQEPKKPKKKKLSLADLEPKKSQAKPEANEQQNAQPKDLSNLVHRPKVVRTTHRGDWAPIADAVAAGNVALFGQLVANVAIHGTEKIQSYPDRFVHWNDSSQVVTLLQTAIRNKDAQMIRAIHAFHPLAFYSYISHGKKLLSQALQYHKEKGEYHGIIDLLLQLGTDQTQTIFRDMMTIVLERDDVDLLQIAITEGNGRYLWTYHDVYKVDERNFYWSFLHVLCEVGHMKFVDLILTRKPNLINSATYTYGYSSEMRPDRTLLHIAALNGHFNIVEYLVGLKADVTITDLDGKTAADLAKNPEIKKYLSDQIELHKKRYTRVNEYTGKSETLEYRSKAILRLLRDFKELLQHPFPTIQAAPLETDIFRWHVLITPPLDPLAPAKMLPLQKIKFHFVIYFPEDYPRSPPKVTPSTNIPHPNVFGRYICLDMLQPPNYAVYNYNTDKWETKTNGSWTAAYSVSSILMQLQSFLFDENVPQWNNKTVANKVAHWQRENTYLDAAEFQCQECGYNVGFNAVDPQVAARIRAKIEKEEQEKKKKLEALGLVVNQGKQKVEPVETYAPEPIKDPRVELAIQLMKRPPLPVLNLPAPKQPSLFPKLPDDVIVEIMDYLVKIEDLSSLLRTCKRFRDVGWKYSIWTRRELLCFYSKRSFHEDILGIGLYVERHKGTDKLKTLSSPLDLISRTAYLEDELRESAWKETLHYWLPLPINQIHSKAALPLIKSMLTAIVKNVNFTPKVRLDEQEKKKGPNLAEILEFEKRMDTLRGQFDPLIVLDVLPKLMNHMVVALMKQDNQQGIIPLHASEKALLGYCSYHHILLNLVHEFPQIQERVDFYLNEFLKHESRRVKRVIPDLGEMLVRLSIASKITWKDVAPYFLQEFFDRTVVWTLDQKHGDHAELAFLETDEVSEYRLATTLETTRTSTRLLMFQVFFLRHVARPEGKTLKDILQDYNNSYGRPQPGIPEKLQHECKKIHNVHSWDEFYKRIGLAVPTKAQITSMLRDSVRRSEKKGYHVCRVSQVDLLKWRSLRDLGMECLKDAIAPIPSVAAKLKADDAEKTIAEAVGNLSQGRERFNRKKIKLFVGNLSFRVDSDALYRSFQQFGHLVKATVPTDEKGRPKGFGFLLFDDEHTVATVLEYMQGADIDDRNIRIERVSEESDQRRGEHPSQPSQQEGWTKAKSDRAKNVNQHKDHSKSTAPRQANKTTTPQQKPTQPSKTTAPTKNAKSSNPFDLLANED